MKIFTRLCLGLLFVCLFGTSGLFAQEKQLQDAREMHEIKRVKEVKEKLFLEGMHQQDVRADRPLIGIYTGHSDNGVAISSTVDGGGAAAAGLEAGDIITAINGTDLRNTHDLQVALSKYQGGQQVAVTYQRYGQTREANVTLKAKPIIRADRPLIGIFPESNAGNGVRVDDISAGGGAVSAGIKSGDVITKINGQAINSETDLKEQLSKYEAGDQVAVEYLRNKQVNQTQVTLKDRSESHNNRSHDRDPCAVFIGVSLSGSGPEGRGVQVSNIIDETPAKASGVKSGDAILALDDVYVNTFNELLHERNKHQPNDYFTLTVLREGQVISIDAQFKSCEKEEPTEEAPTETVKEEVEAPQDIIIDNSLKVEQWKAYPNPAFGTLNVQFQAEAVPTSVRLIDASGRSVYRETVNQFDGYYNQQIDLSDITPGSYYLQIRQGDQFVTEKIVVMPRA
jgi:S1-C subfamily serine protease